MIRLRALMMIAGLFAMATAAHGQSLSPASIQVLRNTEASNLPFYLRYPPTYVPPSPPYPPPSELARLEAEAVQLANEPLLPPWLTQAVEQGVTTWQKLRAMNGGASMTGMKCCCDAVQPGIVKGAGQAKPVIQQIVEHESAYEAERNAGPPFLSFNFSAIAKLPLNVGIKDFLLFTCPAQSNMTQATPPCCCAKGCANCETCKAKTTTPGVQCLDPKERAIEYRLKQPISINFRDVPLQQAIKHLSVQTGIQIVLDLGSLQKQRINLDAPISLIVQDIAMKDALRILLQPLNLSCAIENQVLQVRALAATEPPSFTQARICVVTPTPPMHLPLPRFESPDFEVHCEKITHRGDTVIFEGNVMLLSKKHAQPIRINAQRVILNVKDGSYTVESGRQISMPTPVSSFGILRTSTGCEAGPAMPCCDHAPRPNFKLSVAPPAPAGIMIDLLQPRDIEVIPAPPEAPPEYHMPQLIVIGASIRK